MRDLLKEFTEKRKDRKAKKTPVRIATTLGALAVAAFVMWSLMAPGIAMGDDDPQEETIVEVAEDEEPQGEVFDEAPVYDNQDVTEDSGHEDEDTENVQPENGSVDNTDSGDNKNQNTTDTPADSNETPQDNPNDSANTNGNAQENANGSVTTNGNPQENVDNTANKNEDMQKTTDVSADAIETPQKITDSFASTDEKDQENTDVNLLEIQEEYKEIAAFNSQDNDIDEGVTVTVSPKDSISDGRNGQTLKVKVISTASNTEQIENKKVKLNISTLPDGVTLAGFNAEGEMEVEYKTGSEKLSLTLKIETNEDGNKYVTYSQPSGATLEFELTFNSTNGTMEKSSIVTVTPEIEDKTEKDKCSDPVELKWSGENKWDNLKKTVNKTEIDVTKDNNQKDQLGDILTYTISADQHNGDQNTDTGAIWTKEVKLTDTLTLPNGMKFAEGTKVSDDKTQIVDKDGNTVFYFNNLPNTAKVNNLTINGNTVKYDITIPNPYIGTDQVPTEEMDSIRLICQLNTSKVEIKNNYASQEQASNEKIENKVYIKTVAYKGEDSYEAQDSVKTTPKLNNNFKITKTANKEEVKPGDEIQYTITINNTGNLPLSADKEVTDTLPDYLVLTDAQKKGLETKGASVSTENGKTTITWKPGEIAVGGTRSLEFNVNVASAEEMKTVGDDTEITNKASYSGSDASSTVIYKKPKLEITKSNNKKDQAVKNGDIITYTITIENKEDIITAAQEIEDNLQNGLTFINMVDEEGKPITITDGKFYAKSGTGENGHEVKLIIEGQKLTWKLGALAAKEKVTLYYTCKVDTDQLGSGVTTIKNTAKSTITGEKSEESENTVENAISINKKVNGEKANVYKNGDIINYSITIKNAEGEAASKATDLILKDKLPAGLVPCYPLYTLKNAGKTFGNITRDDLIEDTKTLEDYVKDLSSWDVCYTIIENEVVSISKEWGSDDLRSVNLEWYVGSMDQGKTIEKKYQVKLCMSDSQIKTGKNVIYTNTATIKNVSSSEIIYGRDSSGMITLEKIVTGSLNYNTLTDAQKEAIKFTITCENPAYSREIKLSEFTIIGNEKATYKLSNLPYGIYTITETGYDGTEFDGHQDTITIEGGDSVEVTGSSVKVTISEDSKETAEIKIRNEYETTDSSKVDIQKSVWAIKDVYFDEYGNEISNILSSKSIFDKSSHNGQKDGIYVIYNISVMNTGDKNVHISKIIDELPNGLTYVGMKSDLYNTRVSDFNNNITTGDSSIINTTSFVWNEMKSGITITKEEIKDSTITFKVGNEEGIDLEKSKVFSFFIMCKVDSEVDIDTYLTNTAKLIVDKSVEYKEYGHVTMKNTGHDDKQNNGYDNNVTEDGENRIISSAVTIKPTKSIVPGITKTAKGYIGLDMAASTMTPFTDENKKKSISPQSTVKWEIELINDGTVPITDYRITDIVDAPFHILTKKEANGKLNLTSPFTLQVGNGQPVDLSERVWNTLEDETKQSFTVSISSADNLTIPVGGKAVLTVYTKNDIFSTDIYKNEAIFTPSVQENVKFDGDSVVNGELVKDSSGKYTGVKASDSVYALGDYGSFSWKTVTEKKDKTNHGVGYESHNYITIDGEQSKEVIYTNNIENVSTNPFRNLVIMDLMPYKGDTGVLNKKERGSQFKVTFSNSLKIYDKTSENDVNPKEIENWNVFFSSETSFDENEMMGTLDSSVWHAEWREDDKSFCVVLPDDYLLASTHILTLEYEGTIGDDANPGEIAWNSFGYYYAAQTSSGTQGLRAEPPKVGVMIKKQSNIRKVVVDGDEKEQTYDENKKFTFTIYGGPEASGTPIGSFEICQGGSVNLNELKNTDGNPITLQSGTTYTVTETGMNGCTFDGVGKEGETLDKNDNKYTFTYNAGEAITIVFRNKMSSYVLPATGGVGVARYFAGGALLMSIAALLYGCLWRRRRERGLR